MTSPSRVARTFELLTTPWDTALPADAARISAWEQQQGFRLPHDYRRFLVEARGGYVRPFAFRIPEAATADTISYRAPEDSEGPTMSYDFELDEVQSVHSIDSFDLMLDRSQLTVPQRLRTIPPGHLGIGSTEAQLVLLLAITPATAGRISLWPYEPSEPWGHLWNFRFVPIAPTFTAFLDLLHEIPKAYSGLWKGPGDPLDASEIRRITF